MHDLHALLVQRAEEREARLDLALKHVVFRRLVEAEHRGADGLHDDVLHVEAGLLRLQLVEEALVPGDVEEELVLAKHILVLLALAGLQELHLAVQ